MSKDVIQVAIPGLMTVSAMGGPALIVGVGAAVAIGYVGYAACQYVNGGSNKKISSAR